MSTDVNKFDTALKKKLALDLAFRSGLWLVIAAFASYFSFIKGGINPLQYFERVSNTLSPVVNVLGVIGLLLSVLAMLLKDLEATMSTPHLVEATRGWIGGFVRRIAGDLSLWTFGALLTVLAAFAVALVPARMTPSEVAAVTSLGTLLVMMAALTGLLSIYVRRHGPSPLVTCIKNPVILGFGYVVALGIIIVRLIATAA